MKRLLTIIFLLPLFALAQNPISITYLKPGGSPALYSTPDTVIVSVKGTSGFWSTTVKLAATTTVKPYKAPVVVPPPVDLAPTVNLGLDLTYTLSAGETSRIISLSPIVSDESPSTLTYLWTGPGVSASAKTQNISLAAGTHTFTLRVTDAGGKSAMDDVKVTINPAPVEPPPTTKKPELLAQFTKTGPIVKGTPIPNELGVSWSTQQFARNDQVTLVDDGRLPGVKGVRFILKRNDPFVSNRCRAEITLPSKEKEGDDVYYGFSIKFNNYPSDDQPKSFFQIHDQDPSAGSPGFMIYARRGFAEMVLTQANTAAAGRYETGKNSENSGWYPQITYGKKIPLQKWVDFVIRRKMSSTGQGIIQIWQDGVLVLSRMPGDAGFNGITNYAEPNTEYVKIGHYCHKWPDNFACSSGQKNPDGTDIDCYSVDMIYSNFKRYFAQPGESAQDGFNIVNPAIK